MKILITGGTGFLGRHLVWHFSALGMEVVFTGRNREAANVVMQQAQGAVEWQPLEHGSPEAPAILKCLAIKVDVVIHCAALSSPWGKTEDFYRSNVASTIEVLAACHDAKVRRLVHISTPSIYFNFRDDLNIREDKTLPPPINEYARSKAKAEALIRANPLPETVILRPRAIFGPWDQTLIPRLLRVMQRGSLPIMRGGHIQLDLTYIDNAVDAVWLAVSKPLPHTFVTYNVSNGEPQTLLTLLQSVAREFSFPLRTRNIPWPVINVLSRGMEIAARLGNGKEPMLTRYSAGVLAFSQTLNIHALRNELGYRPKVMISEGIQRHAEWWRNQHNKASL